MDPTVLEEMGLSNAEAKIYLALLERGQSKTGAIIDATKMQSSTVYHVIGSLVEKGLVSYVLKGEVKYFQAERPESFLLFLEEKKRKFEESLPQLREMEKLGESKQTAKVYEGMNGLRAAYNDILLSLKKGDEYYFIQVPEERLSDEKIINLLRSHHIRRAKRGIRVKGLAPRSAKRTMSERIFKDAPLHTIRYSEEAVPKALVIYDNKVITLDFGDIPVAFVMESKAVADSYKRFFEEKWKAAKG